MKSITKITFSLILSFLLFVSFSGITLANWTAEGNTINKITTADLKGELKEIYEQGQTVVPNTNIEKKVWCKNTGETDVLVRIKVSFKWEDGTTVENIVEPNYNTKNWFYKDGYWYYKGYLKPQEETLPLFESFYLSNKIGNDRSGQKGNILVESEYILAAKESSSFWNISFEELDIKTEPNNIKDINSVVTFKNPTDGFIFEEDGDLFYSFKNLVAGNNLSRKIKVGNTYAENVEIFLSAEATKQDGNIEKIEKLLKDYTKIKITDSNSNIIYEGPIWDNKTSMLTPLSLGKFKSNEFKEYYVSIFVSSELPDDYRNLLGKVQWDFLAMGDENQEDIISSDNKQTGNSLLTIIAPELAILSGCIFILLLFKKRKEEKNQNENI